MWAQDHVSFAQDQDAAVLLDGTFVKEMVNKQEDAGGRIVETVTYVDQGSFKVDAQGRLHPTKLGMFAKVQELLMYINTPSPAVKWG